MPQNDPASVDKMLANAKAALYHADTVQTPKAPAAAPAKPVVSAKPAVKAPTTMDELKARQSNIDAVKDSLPKMHTGGPVPADGPYMLKKGEHVLTAKEAVVAHKHALMMSGLKSMARGYKAGDSQAAAPAKMVSKSASTKGQPVKIDAMHKKSGSKSSTKDVVVRPEKNQAAQVKQQMER